MTYSIYMPYKVWRRVEELRGDEARSRWVRRAIERAIEDNERAVRRAFKRAVEESERKQGDHNVREQDNPGV